MLGNFEPKSHLSNSDMHCTTAEMESWPLSFPSESVRMSFANHIRNSCWVACCVSSTTLRTFLCINTLPINILNNFLSLFSRRGILMLFCFRWVNFVVQCKTWLLLLAFQYVEVFLILKAFCYWDGKVQSIMLPIYLFIFFGMAYELRLFFLFLFILIF